MSTKENILGANESPTVQGVKITKHLPSIRDFSELLHSYETKAGKRLINGKFSWDNEIEEVEFYYLLLGDDAVIWDQQIKILQDQEITLLQAQEERRAYIFTYFFKTNGPLRINDDHIFNQGKLIFCNDRGQYRLCMPQDFEGHLMQIVISESFLRNYVAPHQLHHPIVDDIVNHRDPEPMIISGLPNYVHAALHDIVNKLYSEYDLQSQKLTILQLTASFVDIFFQEYLQQQARNNKLQLDTDFKKTVRNVLRQRLMGTFCGVSFLADYFGTSESTFKRHFTLHFGTTPLNYFRRMQIDEAKKLLSSRKYSVEQVARKLGFSAPSNFIRTFKQYEGCTPNKFMKTNF